MDAFRYYMPTEVFFGRGIVKEKKELFRQLGKRAYKGHHFFICPQFRSCCMDGSAPLHSPNAPPAFPISEKTAPFFAFPVL